MPYSSGHRDPTCRVEPGKPLFSATSDCPLATPASEKEGFPEIRHRCLFYRFFRTMSDKPPKQMKGFERKTTESVPTPQFSTRGHRDA